MARDPAVLGRTRYDLLVVGGGVHGLFAAYDAAARGLRVALVERDDFGSGLSFNHQRTVHGGLRALEDGHVGKTLSQIAERRAWARIAPHYLRPLPFLVGTRPSALRSKAVLGLGLLAYDTLGWRRNAGLPAALHLPRGRILSRADLRARVPGIDDTGLTGAAMWHDYQLRHPDRLNWLIAVAARQAGAVLFNHAEALAPLRSGAAITGARVRLSPTDETIDVEAASTLLCAGSGLAVLHDRFGVSGAPPLLRAMNLLIGRQPPPAALAAPGRSGRMLTCVPWAGCALVGTFQSPAVVSPGETGAPAGLVDEMLDDARGAFAFLEASRADIRLVHYGLTPAIVRSGRAELLPDSRLIQHASRGVPGLDSLIGVKFTTARLAAAHAVDVIAARLGIRASCRTADAPLPYADLTASASLDDRVVDWYGGEAAAVQRFCLERTLATPLAEGCAIATGEIAYAAEHADALSLADAVLRRTPLGATGHPGQAALAAAADVLARQYGWTNDRRTAEIAAVDARFVVP